jgi:hypothetical protein
MMCDNFSVDISWRGRGLPDAVLSGVRSILQGQTPNHDLAGAITSVSKAGDGHFERFLANGKPLFEPDIGDPSLMALYGDFVVPRTAEVIAHGSGHISLRVRSRWIDFRWEDPSVPDEEKRIVRTDKELRPTRVPAIVHAYGGLAYGTLFSGTEAELDALEKGLLEAPVPIPFDWSGDRGETCLSYAARLLETHAPQLGITYEVDPPRFLHALRNNPNRRLTTVYSSEAQSLFGSQAFLDALAPYVAHADAFERSARKPLWA